MRMSPFVAITCALALCLLSGCEKMPGYPKHEWKPPQDNLNFQSLYKTNCQACHGADGQGGMSVSLGNPEYLGLVNNATLKKWIANGNSKYLMPAFAKSQGGTLTDKQVEVLVKGLRKRWGKPDPFDGATPPPYEQPAAGGNAEQGRKDYEMYCESCHEGVHKSITNPTYLALVSNQTLRTITIAGRPDLGQPDWRHDKPGHPLTDKEVTDIVTYLASLRVAAPGQPYPSHP